MISDHRQQPASIYPRARTVCSSRSIRRSGEAVDDDCVVTAAYGPFDAVDLVSIVQRESNDGSFEAWFSYLEIRAGRKVVAQSTLRAVALMHDADVFVCAVLDSDGVSWQVVDARKERYSKNYESESFHGLTAMSARSIRQMIGSPPLSPETSIAARTQ